nr:hypothetical protein [uncultured bacterium]
MVRTLQSPITLNHRLRAPRAGRMEAVWHTNLIPRGDLRKQSGLLAYRRKVELVVAVILSI